MKKAVDEINAYNYELEVEQRVNEINEKLEYYILKSSKGKNKMKGILESNSQEKDLYQILKICSNRIRE